MTTEYIDARIAKIREEINNPQPQATEIYTRIVGYYRSLNNWNPGKREEYRHRETYHVPQAPKDAHDPPKRTESAEKRTTFRPDQPGALPIVGQFAALQLDNADDWDLGEREEGANQYETCESCQ
jgi:ribonucleoside-triphosphate reductase